MEFWGEANSGTITATPTIPSSLDQDPCGLPGEAEPENCDTGMHMTSK